MNPLRLSVRFPVREVPPDLEPAIGAFHRFIRQGLVEGFVLDVADYRHVPRGPGVMLVGHDVDYGVNHDEFTAVRKRSASDPAAVQLRDLLRMGLGAIDAIADDHELAVTCDRSRFEVSVHDRRLGPSEEVGNTLRAEVEPVVSELFGEDASVTVAASDDPRRAPSVRVQADPQAATSVLQKLGGSHAPGQSAWDITVEELARLRDSAAEFVLLDVREESEYEIVHLGGKLAPLAQLGAHVDELDREARIVVHCRGGHRGAKATTQLRAAGFEDVWNLNGGLMAWIDRVDPSLPRY
ncbi:MAG TPA: rhodanese-like domain-containing protein [Nitriliruptorales bacterium]